MDCSSDVVLVWMLRVCVAMTFFGHGYLATKTQAAWYAYLAVAGIGRNVGAPLMRIIGVLDIGLAVAVVFAHPLPLVHVWCFVWGLSTAAMRPLAGESIHQLIERSGNFLPALALLWIESKTPAAFQDYLILSGVAIAGLIVVSALLRVTGLLKDRSVAKAN